FCPHEAIRDMVLAFKRNFSGPWQCWRNVPEHVRAKCINDFEVPNCTNSVYDKPLYQLSMPMEVITLSGMSQHSSCNFVCFSSLRFRCCMLIGDSMEQLIRPVDELEAGRGRSTLRIRWFSIMTWCPPSDELFLKFDGVLAIGESRCFTMYTSLEHYSIHQSVSLFLVPLIQLLVVQQFSLVGYRLMAYQWTIEHEQVVPNFFLSNTFTDTVKDKVGETSTLRNEESLEVDDRGMERNTTINGEDEGEKASEDDVNLLKMNLSNIPTQQIFETPEFQQLFAHLLEQRMMNMQEHVQMDIRENMEAQVTIVFRADVVQMLGFTPQPPPNGSGSTPNVP
ncbi:hypothetical protein MTR67_018240, partial [Solanum verrucosum]